MGQNFSKIKTPVKERELTSDLVESWTWDPVLVTADLKNIDWEEFDLKPGKSASFGVGLRVGVEAKVGNRNMGIAAGIAAGGGSNTKIQAKQVKSFTNDEQIDIGALVIQDVSKDIAHMINFINYNIRAYEQLRYDTMARGYEKEQAYTMNVIVTLVKGKQKEVAFLREIMCVIMKQIHNNPRISACRTLFQLLSWIVNSGVWPQDMDLIVQKFYQNRCAQAMRYITDPENSKPDQHGFKPPSLEYAYELLHLAQNGLQDYNTKDEKLFRWHNKWHEYEMVLLETQVTGLGEVFRKRQVKRINLEKNGHKEEIFDKFELGGDALEKFELYICWSDAARTVVRIPGKKELRDLTKRDAKATKSEAIEFHPSVLHVLKRMNPPPPNAPWHYMVKSVRTPLRDNMTVAVWESDGDRLRLGSVGYMCQVCKAMSEDQRRKSAANEVISVMPRHGFKQYVGVCFQDENGGGDESPTKGACDEANVDAPSGDRFMSSPAGPGPISPRTALNVANNEVDDDDRWYYTDRAGKVQGPLSSENMLTLYESNAIRDKTWVRPALKFGITRDAPGAVNGFLPINKIWTDSSWYFVP